MTAVESAFLALTRSAIHAEPAVDPELSGPDWAALFRLADLHKLLPLIADAASALPSLRRAAMDQSGSLDWSAIRSRALSQVNRQMAQENEFLNFLLALRAEGLEPLVLKGAICRALYPQPLLRPSVDDDLLIPADRASDFHRAILAQHLTCDRQDTDPETAEELSYHRPDSPLYLEVHKALFDSASPVFGPFNRFFSETLSHPVRVRIQDVELLTAPPTDHLLFLLLHAYKHLLFGGFGVRVIADLCLFSRAHAAEIDFPRLREICESLRCGRFAAAVYRIGEAHLGIPAPEAFRLEIDEAPLLADVLDAGNLGEDLNRHHSTNIILNTVASDRTGARKRGSLRSAVFLPASQLQGRYPFLKRRSWLLPWAWTRRVCSYAGGRLRRRGGAPTATLRVARARTELLRKYGVID